MVHFCGSLGVGFSSGIPLRSLYSLNFPAQHCGTTPTGRVGAVHLEFTSGMSYQALLFKQETFREKISNSRA